MLVSLWRSPPKVNQPSLAVRYQSRVSVAEKKINLIMKKIKVNNPLTFLIQEEPPSATAQQKRVRMLYGRPQMYDPPNVRKAKKQLRRMLEPFAPDKPFEGPIKLEVTWYFGLKSCKESKPKITRPDTDNLQKALKDVMTDCGFWRDDAQVFDDRAKKINVPYGEGGLLISIERLNEERRTDDAFPMLSTNSLARAD